jgi:chromate reductase
MRRESFSRKIARYVAGLLPDDFEVRFLDIGGLALYNQDFDIENRPPEAWTRFREQVAEIDSVLVVTPEYNRSIPAVLKNAIDIASSAPEGNQWSGKSGAVVSISPGNLGGALANAHVRQLLTYLNVYVMHQPEQMISNAASVISESGYITNAHKQESLRRFMEAYAEWVRAHGG